MNRPFVIGSRGSELALWQANHIAGLLLNIGFETRIQVIKTQGDLIQNLSFDKMEGKGFFTKEIEDALLRKEIDIAVHSCKDLETHPPDGLCIAAMTTREDPADVILIKPDAYDPQLPLFVSKNIRIGTSSMRRKALIQYIRPDVQLLDLRGNVPTRIQKLREGRYDAIILAAAGIKRLQIHLDALIALALPAQNFVPAPAQGVLALQCRSSDSTLKDILARLHHIETGICASAERALLHALDGGCQLPFGAYCRSENGFYRMSVAFARSMFEPVSTFDVISTDPSQLPALALQQLK